MKIIALSLITVLAFGCSKKVNQKARGNAPFGGNIDPTPTPAPEPPPQPTPKPPQKPDPEPDKAALIEKIQAASKGYVIKQFQIASSFKDDEKSETLSESFYQCGLSELAPSCLDDSIKSFSSDVLVKENLFYHHFTIESYDEHFLLLIEFDSMDSLSVKQVEFRITSDLFEEPKNLSEINAESVVVTTLELASDPKAHIYLRLLENPSYRELFHLPQILSTYYQSPSDRAFKDRITKILWGANETIGEAPDNYQQALFRTFYRDMGAAGEIEKVMSESLYNKETPELSQIGAVFLLRREPENRKYKKKAIAALKHRFAFTRFEAINSLDIHTTIRASAQADIIRRVNDSDPVVARRAYNAAKSFQFGSAHFKAFREIIDTEIEKNREFAIYLLSNYRSKTSVAILVENLDDPNIEFSKKITETLLKSSLLKKNFKKLVKHYEHFNWRIRLNVTKLLRIIVTKKSLKAVRKQFNIEATFSRPRTDLTLTAYMWDTIRELEKALLAPEGAPSNNLTE